MHSTYTAIIDANVFYSARLTHLVMMLHREGVFRARWTNKIHDEWIKSVHKRKSVPLDQLHARRDAMNEKAEDALVAGYERLMCGIELPDPNDRHVVAAAVLTCA
ncbi:MAG: PIN domain-containing protein, partial [Pirellulaceae bacterium]|nr:PIN domain-containing protein [Pirellulaceae bacterium]